MFFRIPLAQFIFICHNFVIELLKWVGKKVKLNFNMSMATAVNTGRHPFAQRCCVQERDFNCSGNVSGGRWKKIWFNGLSAFAFQLNIKSNAKWNSSKLCVFMYKSKENLMLVHDIRVKVLQLNFNNLQKPRRLSVVCRGRLNSNEI